MWWTITASCYDPSTGKWRTHKLTLESNHLDVLLVQLAEDLQALLREQDLPPISQPSAHLIVAMEISSWACSSKAATRDTAAERTLQLMRTSLARFLCSGGSSRAPGSPETFSDFSPN